MSRAVGLLVLAMVVLLLVGAAGSWYALRRAATRIERWESPTLANRSQHGSDGPRVAFMGASITEAWPLGRFFPGYITLNAGVGGNLAGQQLLRFKADVLDRHPDAVVIKACAINFASSGLGRIPPQPDERVKDSLAMMVEMAQARGIAPVLCTPVPVGREYARAHSKENLHENLLALGDWVRTYAEDRGIEVADLHEALADDAGYLPPRFQRDSLHPNETGYEALSPVVRDAIERSLGLEQAE